MHNSKRLILDFSLGFIALRAVMMIVSESAKNINPCKCLPISKANKATGLTCASTCGTKAPSEPETNSLI